MREIELRLALDFHAVACAQPLPVQRHFPSSDVNIRPPTRTDLVQHLLVAVQKRGIQARVLTYLEGAVAAIG